MRQDRLLRRELRSRVMVTTDSAETFDGVLFELDDRHLVLADVESVAVNGDRLKVDGKVWIPRLTITYMQQPRT